MGTERRERGYGLRVDCKRYMYTWELTNIVHFAWKIMRSCGIRLQQATCNFFRVLRQCRQKSMLHCRNQAAWLGARCITPPPPPKEYASLWRQYKIIFFFKVRKKEWKNIYLSSSDSYNPSATAIGTTSERNFVVNSMLVRKYSITRCSIFMYRRAILCTFQIAVDFYYVRVGRRGGGGGRV